MFFSLTREARFVSFWLKIGFERHTELSEVCPGFAHVRFFSPEVSAFLRKSCRLYPIAGRVLVERASRVPCAVVDFGFFAALGCLVAHLLRSIVAAVAGPVETADVGRRSFGVRTAHLTDVRDRLGDWCR